MALPIFFLSVPVKNTSTIEPLFNGNGFYRMPDKMQPLPIGSFFFNKKVK
jgi:hypothetical protein